MCITSKFLIALLYISAPLKTEETFERSTPGVSIYMQSLNHCSSAQDSGSFSLDLCYVAKYSHHQAELLAVGTAHVYFTFYLGGSFEIHPICPLWCGNRLWCKVTQVSLWCVLSWALLSSQRFRGRGELLWVIPARHSARGQGGHMVRTSCRDIGVGFLQFHWVVSDLVKTNYKVNILLWQYQWCRIRTCRLKNWCLV